MVDSIRRGVIAAAAYALMTAGDPASACMVPASGPDFDRHLQIEVVDESAHEYRLTVPIRIGRRPFAAAWINWIPKHEETEGAYTEGHFEELTLSRDGEFMTGVFRLVPVESNTVATVAARYEGVCDAYARVIIDVTRTEADN